LVFVVLDESNCVTDVWKIVLPAKKNSSSSKAVSSSSKNGTSSSSTKKEDVKNSSSSVAPAKKGSSSSNGKGTESSNSKAETRSSSSAKSNSSSSGKHENGSSSNEKTDGSSSSKIGPSETSSSEEASSSSSIDIPASSSSSETAEDGSSSSEEPIIRSSAKKILAFRIYVNGVRDASAEKDDDKKKFYVKLSAAADTSRVQMYSMMLSDGASSNINLQSNLGFKKGEEYTYEYDFTVTAEDGSYDKWKIVVEIPKGVKLSDFAVDVEDSYVTVEGNKIYVEFPYDSTLDLTSLKVLPMDTNANLLRPLEMKFVDDNDELQTYTVVAGMQLPGTSFKSLDLNFWGTTSTAMGISATAADIKVSSSENLSLDNPGITLTSKVLEGETAILGVKGSEKLAGGFYFTGSYGGTSALSIYDRTNSGSTPSINDSDISKDMTFGRPFKGRPTSFKVDYSYEHVDGSNDDYPQQFLIYVLLVSEDNYVVAGGILTGIESVSSDSKEVPLMYGSDAGVLNAGLPVSSALEGVDEAKDVASIHIMFASSAYAFIVSGAALGGYEKKFRGAAGAALSIKSFRLNY